MRNAKCKMHREIAVLNLTLCVRLEVCNKKPKPSKCSCACARCCCTNYADNVQVKLMFQTEMYMNAGEVEKIHMNVQKYKMLASNSKASAACYYVLNGYTEKFKVQNSSLVTRAHIHVCGCT